LGNAIERREYYLQCLNCGGTGFKFSQIIDLKEGNNWEHVEMDKAFCHSGFGWELEDFDIICIACGHKDPEVKYREIKD